MTKEEEIAELQHVAQVLADHITEMEKQPDANRPAMQQLLNVMACLYAGTIQALGEARLSQAAFGEEE